MFCTAHFSLFLLLAKLSLVSCGRYTANTKQDLLAGDAANASSQQSLRGTIGRPEMEEVSHAQMNLYAAGFAAVAKMQPRFIEESLGTPVTGPNGKLIYQVKLYINGIQTTVAIDEQVPVTDSDPADFTFIGEKESKKSWQVLIEKAFAKAYGSYWTLHHQAESSDIIKAITGLPVDSRTFEGERIYKFNKEMSKLLKAKSPVTARSRKSWYEVAVVGYQPGPKMLELYNPNVNVEEEAVGSYELAESSFLEDFDVVSVGHAEWQHRTSIRIPVGEPVALVFEAIMHSDRKRLPTGFKVDLELPSALFADSFACPLDLDNVAVKLLISKQGGKYIGNPWSFGQRESPSRWSVEDEDYYNSNGGRWLVYVYTSSFEHLPWLKEVTVTVFHRTHDVTIERALDPLAVGRDIMGFPCQNIKDPGTISYYDDNYMALPFLVDGAPAWQLKDKETILWLDVNAYKIKKSPSVKQLKQYDQEFDHKVLICKKQQPSQPVVWLRPVTRSHRNKPCDFSIGERVLLGKPQDGGATCAEIDGTFEGSTKVRLRFRETQTKVLECSDREIKKVTQCHPLVKGDGILIEREGRWVSDKVARVDCGSVLIEGGETVPCGKGLLGYQGHCLYRPGELVAVWDRTLKRYSEIYGKVKSHSSGNVDVLHDGQEKRFDCKDSQVKRLPRCTKGGLSQVERLEHLDNVQDIMDNGGDPLFPAARASIGPDDPNCGDFCQKYDHWADISSILS